MENRYLHSPAGLLSLSHEGYVLEVNITFLEELGYQLEELVGQHIEYLCRPAAKMIFHSYFYPSINMYGHVKELFVKLKHKSGQEIPFIMNARQFSIEDELRIDMILLPMRQRMEYEQELKQMTKQLEEINHEISLKQEVLAAINSDLVFQANTDCLTGIANRKYIQETLSEHIQLYQTVGETFSLMMLDIDYFKRVNDTYGHQVGDEVLVKVASVLSDFTRSNQIVGRFGGEEFIILLPGTNPKNSLAAAGRINRIIEASNWSEVGSLTVSIGVATFASGDTDASILNKADEALYYAKNNGRNQARHYQQLVKN